MQSSESVPQTTPGTGLKTKPPRKKNFFLLGCVIYVKEYINSVKLLVHFFFFFFFLLLLLLLLLLFN
jgi:hypothetical protein